MNCIRDFDGRNGKSGGRVLFTGLRLKSGAKFDLEPSRFKRTIPKAASLFP